VASAVISGRIATDDPAGTAARTSRHFAHKVDVDADGDVRRVPILQDIGVQGQPEIYPAHSFVSA
jgi:hypothetical protein